MEHDNTRPVSQKPTEVGHYSLVSAGVVRDTYKYQPSRTHSIFYCANPAATKYTRTLEARKDTLPRQARK
eukprot:5467097-Pyramimonas_sp.AAC.2